MALDGITKFCETFTLSLVVFALPTGFIWARMELYQQAL
jgi:hypothetical protein